MPEKNLNHTEKDHTISFSLKSFGKWLNRIYFVLVLLLLVLISIQLSEVAELLDVIGYQQYVAYNLGGSTADTSNTSDASQLTSTKWYKDHLLGVVTADQLFNLSKDNYVVVFRQDGCIYCDEAEKIIESWINAGNDGAVYFVDLAENPNFWGDQNAVEITEPSPDNIYILGTPSLLVFENGEFRITTGAVDLAGVLESVKY